MGHPAEPVELDVVTRCEPAQQLLRLAAQRLDIDEAAVKPLHGHLRSVQQGADHGVALGVLVRRAPLADLGQPVLQGLDQQTLAFGVVQQVVLQVWIALDDPDVAKHLVQHARGTSGAAFVTQTQQGVPDGLAQ